MNITCLLLEYPLYSTSDVRSVISFFVRKNEVTVTQDNALSEIPEQTFRNNFTPKMHWSKYLYGTGHVLREN